MTEAPAASSSCGVTPLTAPSVPTGMKAGVSMTPCGVVRRPRRARPAVARISKVRGMAALRFARRLLPIPRQVDHPVLDPRGELQHEPVGGQGHVALDVAELVLDGIAVGLDVLEPAGEEGLAVDPQGHALEPLGDALVLGHQLQAVVVALLLGQLELDGEVLEERLQAAARPQVLEDLAGLAPHLQGLGPLEVAVPGGHLLAADDDRDRAGRLVLPADPVRRGVGEEALRLLGRRQHGALLLLGEAGFEGLELPLLVLDAVDQGGQPLRTGQAGGHGVRRGRGLCRKGRHGEKQREQGGGASSSHTSSSLIRGTTILSLGFFRAQVAHSPSTRPNRSWTRGRSSRRQKRWTWSPGWSTVAPRAATISLPRTTSITPASGGSGMSARAAQQTGRASSTWKERTSPSSTCVELISRTALTGGASPA